MMINDSFNRSLLGILISYILMDYVLSCFSPLCFLFYSVLLFDSCPCPRLMYKGAGLDICMYIMSSE